MPSTNKTAINTSQYVGTDKPKYLTDYNNDMLNISNEVIANRTQATNAIDLAQSAIDANTATASALNTHLTTQVTTPSPIHLTPEQQILIGGISNPNLLINGSLKISQRVGAWVSPVNQYTADRYMATGTGVVTHVPTGGLQISGNIIISYNMGADEFAYINGKNVTLSYSIDNTVVTKSYVATTAIGVVNESFSNVTLQWIKLELGNIATPFIPKAYSEELNDCQYYYSIMTGIIATTWQWATFPSTMRAKPNTTVIKVSGTGDPIIDQSTLSGVGCNFCAPNAQCNITIIADAEIYP